MLPLKKSKMTQMDLRSRLEVSKADKTTWYGLVCEYMNQTPSRITVGKTRDLVDMAFPSVIGMLKAVREYEADTLESK